MFSAILSAIASGLRIAATWIERKNAPDMVANAKKQQDQKDVDQATDDVSKGDLDAIRKETET
jgi:hypothetical protein